MKSLFVAAVLSLVLTACGSGTGESTLTHRLTPAEMLTQVRAAGKTGEELDVQPLRDPQVEDLRAAATQAERRGDYRAAAATLTRALAIMPNDPDLLQWQAELALVSKDWLSADRYAMQSY